MLTNGQISSYLNIITNSSRDHNILHTCVMVSDDILVYKLKALDTQTVSLLQKLFRKKKHNQVVEITLTCTTNDDIMVNVLRYYGNTDTREQIESFTNDMSVRECVKINLSEKCYSNPICLQSLFSDIMSSKIL